jgi:hypothetical protein
LATLTLKSASCLASLLKQYIEEWTLADTDTAAELWRREFDQAGIPVQLISGLYQPAESADPPIEHVWLQVDGLLVDPTAGQYGVPADSFDYYQQRTVEAS